MAKNIYRKFISWLNTNFGSSFIHFHKFLFDVYITTNLVLIPFNLFIQEQSFLSQIESFTYWLVFYLIFAVVFTFVWYITKEFFDLDLYFYYYVYIPIIYPKIKRFISKKDLKESHFLDMVIESYKYEKKGKKKCPVFIKREHLERKRFWPHWEFSIVTIFSPEKISFSTRKSHGQFNQKRWFLHADLSGESYGIYNNAGKKFLREKFSIKAFGKEMEMASRTIEEFMKPDTPLGEEIVWGQSGSLLPLRWVSGGVFPIIQYRNHYWAMFFFRDINPIGLNIANGASENKKEYKEIHRLMGREFSEETILFQSHPFPDSNVIHQKFSIDCYDMSSSSAISDYFNEDFSKEHNTLREVHDKVHIQTTKYSQGRPIRPINTPFRIELTYHAADLTRIEKAPYIRNAVFTINPFEFGVEIVWLYKFTLFDNDVIIDGEYDLGRNYLIRQPVILLRMDFLKKIFIKNNNSIGLYNTETDCKILPEIPIESIKFFLDDIPLRKNRLKNIADELQNKDIKQTFEMDNLKYEENRIKKWLNDYEKMFNFDDKTEVNDIKLRTLCPVSWKILEIIFLHNINYQI